MSFRFHPFATATTTVVVLLSDLSRWQAPRRRSEAIATATGMFPPWRNPEPLCVHLPVRILRLPYTDLHT